MTMHHASLWSVQCLEERDHCSKSRTKKVMMIIVSSRLLELILEQKEAKTIT
jgi:hypothetical protein